jgi:tetratricopeptide (TPR) repeat protein
VTKRRAVDLTPDGHPHKPLCLSNLGISLWRRFERTDELDDLERAIVTKRRAVDLTPDDHPDKPTRLTNLGISLQGRFERIGVLDDLEQAITAKRCAVELTPDDHPDKPVFLNNLGISLQRRFERIGELDDLNQAIATKRHAVDLTPEGHPAKPGCLGNLGNALRTRFERIGKIDDLEQSIATNRRAVDLIPDGHANKPVLLSNLGLSLQERFKRIAELDDLEQAIAAHRQAVDLTPDDHSHKLEPLTNLGNALQTRSEHMDDLDDLEQAITTHRRAVDLTPDGHPDKSRSLSNLGISMKSRFERVGEVDDLAATLSIFISAADQQSGPPSTRLGAVALCAIMCWRQVPLGYATHQTLLSIYDRAFVLLPQVVWLGNSIKQRYATLTRLAWVADIVNGGVSAAIEAGNLPRALEWLEAGHAIVWEQLLLLRSPIDNLRDHYPDMSTKLQSLSQQLEHSGYSNATNIVIDGYSIPSHAQTPSTDTNAISTRLALVKDYNVLLADIRLLPGFERFLLPKTFTELAPASKNGPVILLNVHTSRCDALVICHTANHIIHVPLPKLTHKSAEKMCSQLVDALNHARLRDRSVSRESLEIAIDSARGLKVAKADAVSRVLEYLWQLVVQPILQAIEEEVSTCTGIAVLPVNMDLPQISSFSTARPSMDFHM